MDGLLDLHRPAFSIAALTGTAFATLRVATRFSNLAKALVIHRTPTSSFRAAFCHDTIIYLWILRWVVDGWLAGRVRTSKRGDDVCVKSV
jgi:cytochrome b561